MNKSYGIVIGNCFYSNRMDFKLSSPLSNGIYALDMDADDFKASIAPADIGEATKWFRKAPNTKIIRGIGFHDGIIPENPINYAKIPVTVLDATYDDFDEVEAVVLKNGMCYFLQTVTTEKAYPILDVKTVLESNGNNIESVKGVTPEIRIAFVFNIMEAMERRRKELEEKRKKEMAEPVNYIRAVMEEMGAKVNRVKKTNRGFEVLWSSDGHTINTLLASNYRVIEAGFCVSRYDSTQSARSVVNVLKAYVRDGDHVNVTRTAR